MTLFSIDVDAHLKKAATHTFGATAHYPVELVRAALRRKAQRVEIVINKNSIQVQDDGIGLTDKELNILTHIMNPETATAEKEDAVEALQTRDGLGLLAIFAPQPTEIRVDTVNVNSKKRQVLHYRRTQLTISHSNPVGQGTCITLHGKHRDSHREKELLEIFCQRVPGFREIRLNKRLIGGQPSLTGQLAIIDTSPTPQCPEGQVGIPKSGSLCRIRLMDQGIPWHHFSLPPQQGLIFDGVIEYSSEGGKITVSLLNHLLSFVERLYAWLCFSYATAPDYLKDRIEELIFNHCRQTHSLIFLKQIAPFRFYNSQNYTGYSQLKEKAESEKIYAVPQKKERMMYNTGNGQSRWVLSLTREQADLLINHLNLPILFLTPARPRFYGLGLRVSSIVAGLKKKLERVVLLFCPMPKKIIAGINLSSEEAFFLRTLNHYLNQHHPPTHPHASSVKAVLVTSRLPFLERHIQIKPAPDGVVKGTEILYLVRRNHPLVLEAVAAVRQDRENIEIFVPLLITSE